jgi:CRP/FNR family transcriptional regulator, LitR-dependent transcriptional activator
MTAPHQTLTFQRRQTLYHSGDPAQSVFRVRDGLVRIARMTPEGRVLTVRHVLPGDYFGEEAFMDGEREEIAEALTTAQIEAIDPP